jgi:hypothetical protein
MMDWRAFFGTLGQLAAPCAAEAQSSGKVPRIGLLTTGTDPSQPVPPQWRAFFDEMRALGWVERQEPRGRTSFRGWDQRVPGFATELAQLGVDVIVATGLRENEAVRRAATTIAVII